MTTHKHDNITIIQGDCRDVLKDFKRSVTAVVTDPPYGISFMNSGWDHAVPGVDFWSVIQSVCLPGSYMLAFGGTRTYHRQTCAIEDAGWLIRDCLMWVYGSGFPKSHNISIALDKVAGAEREVVGVNPNASGRSSNKTGGRFIGGHDQDRASVDLITKPATPDALTWDGWGTALKPALEPICLAQNPREGTFVDNVLKHGCGGLNVDGCRIDSIGEETGRIRNNPDPLVQKRTMSGALLKDNDTTGLNKGRYPSNLLIDDSPEVIAGFPETTTGAGIKRPNGSRSVAMGDINPDNRYFGSSSGSAARFFYCAKASRAERDAGCDNLTPLQRDPSRQPDNPGGNNPHNRGAAPVRNSHPTVKPLTLMRYLVRLLTQPERNLFLDPFAGSGSTAVACALAGLPCVAIELKPEHVDIIRARVDWALNVRRQLGREPDLDLSPYQKPKPQRPEQGSLF